MDTSITDQLTQLHDISLKELFETINSHKSALHDLVEQARAELTALVGGPQSQQQVCVCLSSTMPITQSCPWLTDAVIYCVLTTARRLLLPMVMKQQARQQHQKQQKQQTQQVCGGTSWGVEPRLARTAVACVSNAVPVSCRQ